MFIVVFGAVDVLLAFCVAVHFKDYGFEWQLVCKFGTVERYILCLSMFIDFCYVCMNTTQVREISFHLKYSDRKVHEANMRPTWVLSAPDGPHVDPMNFDIRVGTSCRHIP